MLYFVDICTQFTLIYLAKQTAQLHACYKQYNVVTMNDRRYIPRNFSPSADFPNESSAINPGLLLPSLKKILKKVLSLIAYFTCECSHYLKRRTGSLVLG